MRRSKEERAAALREKLERLEAGTPDILPMRVAGGPLEFARVPYKGSYVSEVEIDGTHIRLEAAFRTVSKGKGRLRISLVIGDPTELLGALTGLVTMLRCPANTEVDAEDDKEPYEA